MLALVDMSVSGCSIFKSQEFLTLDDGTDRLSRNVGKELPLDAVQAELMNPWHYLQLMNLFLSGSLGREVTCCSEARG